MRELKAFAVGNIVNKEILIKNICFKADSRDILKDINISIGRGESLSLLGPSGCGKTTLLRIIAGLERADSGEILFRGQNMADVPPYRRNFGMMFQDFALFPHRNVFQNVSFGLELKKLSKKEIKSRVQEMLELVNLQNYETRNIKELSGGERQRVALARTLAPSPELIMLDEPLGALDRQLRERLLADLSLILKKTRITTIWVTHDHNEAFAVSDTVCVINSGEVQQIDSPEKLYHNPLNRTVADFLGFQNIIENTIDREEQITGLDVENRNFRKNSLLLIMPDSASVISEDEFLREKSRIEESNKVEPKTISGIIRDILFQGAIRKISIAIPVNKSLNGYIATQNISEQILCFDIPCYTTIPKIGERIFLTINPDGVKLIN